MHVSKIEFFFFLIVNETVYPIFIAWDNEMEQVDHHGKDLRDITNARDYLPAAE